MPVFWSRSVGERRSGLGYGKLVKKGFVFRAVVIASAVEGGQTSVISVDLVSKWLSWGYRRNVMAQCSTIVVFLPLPPFPFSIDEVPRNACASASSTQLTCDARPVAKLKGVPYHGPVGDGEECLWVLIWVGGESRE